MNTWATVAQSTVEFAQWEEWAASGAKAVTGSSNDVPVGSSRMCATKFLLVLELCLERRFRDPRLDLRSMTLANWYDHFAGLAGEVVRARYDNLEDLFLQSAAMRATHRVVMVQFILLECFHGAKTLQDRMRVVARSSPQSVHNPDLVGESNLLNPRKFSPFELGNMTRFLWFSMNDLLVHDAALMHAPLHALDHTATRAHAVRWVGFLAAFPERFGRLLESSGEQTDLGNDFLVSSLLGESQTAGVDAVFAML